MNKKENVTGFRLAGAFRPLLKGILCIMFLFFLIGGRKAATVSAATLAYPNSSSSVKVYKQSTLKTQIDKIGTTTEVTIVSLTNKYTKIKYTAGGKTKTGYVKANQVAMSVNPTVYTAKYGFYVYDRADTNGVQGTSRYVSKNSKIFLYGYKNVTLYGYLNSGFAQIGYKYGSDLRIGWVRKEDYESGILGNNPTPIIAKTGYYYLKSPGPGNKYNKCLDVYSYGKGENSNICFYDSNNACNQRFRVVHVKDGWHKIISSYSNKCIQQTNGNVCIGTYKGSSSQLWKFVDAGSGCVFILNSGDGKYIDVDGAKEANRTNVSTYKLNKQWNQKWKLVNAN